MKIVYNLPCVLYFTGSLDTSEYVPDWEAINANIERNCAIIASLGGEFAEKMKEYGL